MFSLVGAEFAKANALTKVREQIAQPDADILRDFCFAGEDVGRAVYLRQSSASSDRSPARAGLRGLRTPCTRRERRFRMTYRHGLTFALALVTAPPALAQSPEVRVVRLPSRRSGASPCTTRGTTTPPVAADQPLLLEALEGRIQRALVDVQHPRGHLPDPLANAPTVHRRKRERLQDHQIERASKVFQSSSHLEE